MKRNLLILLICLLPLLTACQKDETTLDNEGAGLRTLQVKDIFYNKATLQGASSLTGITEYGFALSEETFDIASVTEYPATSLEGNGAFSVNLDDLTRNTQYAVRAFAQKNNGDKLYGNTILFRTDSIIIDPPAPPVGSISIVDGRSVLAVEQAVSLGDDQMTAADRNKAVVKIADCGIYYWPADQSQNEAVRISIGEELANTYGNGDEIEYVLSGLQPDTEYNYCFFIKSGVYYFTTQWASYSQEVTGEISRFKTQKLALPEVSNVDAGNITATSLNAYGMINSNGFDPEVVFGIEYGSSPDALNKTLYATDYDDATLRVYSVFIKGLHADTEYYYRAFAENGAGKAYASSVVQFKTNQVGKPVVKEYFMDYAFRSASYKTNQITLRGNLISDGGEKLEAQGFYWGYSSETLDHQVAAGSISSDGTYDYFQTVVPNIGSGIIYYKPYARNSFGEVTTNHVCQISTAVDGGYLYRFDMFRKLSPSYNNVYLSNIPAIYFELDPIKTTDGTVYYLLDRNLGANRPYDESFYDRSFLEITTYPDLFDAAGYYYQFDRQFPSITPDVKVATPVDISPYMWSSTPALFNPSMSMASVWESDVCPEGYDLPTVADIKAIMNAIEPDASKQTLENIFAATRFGVTASRMQGNGNIINTNPNKATCEIWLKDESSIMRIQAPPRGLFEVVSIPNRYSGRPIRCVRKVTSNQ